MPFAHITGWGMHVPEPVLTNEDIAKLVDTSDEWIRDRTGISERRIARDTEFPSTLAVEASLKALQVANLAPTELDLIICSTSTPEYIFPATACLIQDQIGATKAGAFDLSAACSGFIYATNMAAQAIRSGSIKNALVIGTETLSRFVNWKDRNTGRVRITGEREARRRAFRSDALGRLRRLLVDTCWRRLASSRNRDDHSRGQALHPNGRQGGLPLRHPRDGERRAGGSSHGKPET